MDDLGGEMTDTPRPEDGPGTFCYYCQSEYGQMDRLLRHLAAEHQGTHAYRAYCDPNAEVTEGDAP